MDGNSNSSSGRKKRHRRVLFRAVHHFVGNPSERQLGFAAGAFLLADTHKQQNGWIWARPYSPQHSNTVAGWCPLSYLVQAEHEATPPPAVPDASAAHTFPDPFSEQTRMATAMPTAGPSTHPSIPLATATRIPITTTMSAQNNDHNTDWFAGPTASMIPTVYEDDDSNNSDLFAGPPMGGAWNEANDPRTDTYFPHQHVDANSSSTSTGIASSDGTDGNNRSKHGSHRFGTRIRNAGSSLSQSVSRVGTAVSSGAAAAGNGIKQAAHHTKNRIQDRKQQLQQQQQQQQQRTTTMAQEDPPQQRQPDHTHQLYQPQQRTQAHQTAINSGNCAARTAVAGGVVGGILRGPAGAVRGATHGAMYGGTYGAVQGWKPFG